MSGIVDLFYNRPDTAPPTHETILSRELGQEMHALAREQFEFNKERTTRMDEVTGRVVDQQLRIGEKQEALTDDYTQFMKETYEPATRKLTQQALDYNLPEEMEREAGKGRATVAQQFDVQRGVLGRELGRYGFDPNRFAAINTQLASDEATASAGAANTGRDVARDRGHGYLIDAVNATKGLPASQATSAGVSLAAGSQGAGNQRAGDIGAISTTNAALPWYGGAGSMYGQAGGLNMTGYQASLGAQVAMRQQDLTHMADVYKTTASMVGGMMGASDRKLKSDVLLVGKLTPEINVYDYTISGRRERGVMADEVEKVYPQFVTVAADGYKRVNYPGLLAKVGGNHGLG